MLAALASVGSFATSILLPSLSSMAKSLNVSTAAVASAISVYLAVFAVGQLAVGPLSDRYGRWKPVIVGLVIFVAGSLWCEFAALPSPDWPGHSSVRRMRCLGYRGPSRDLLAVKT